MRRWIPSLLIAAAAWLVAVPAASAQTLEEICPGAVEGTGALWGAVMDTDGDMTLPGATVVATWSEGGVTRTAEARVASDGAYRMCGVPLHLPLSVQASFSSSASVPVAVTMTGVFTRQDLNLSLSGAPGVAGPDERLWVCVDGGESEFNLRFSRLVRCDEGWQPLEQCPKIELGRLNVQPVGAGSGMLREMTEQLVIEAKRLGANAIVNLRDGRGSTSLIGTDHSNTLTGEAVLIEVDPSTCK